MRMVAALAAAPLALGGLAGPALAEQNDVTPSTNDANKTAGWANFDATPAEDSVTLTFTTTRGFNSCFEYRADGEPTTSTAVNPNSRVTDGLWEYVCVSSTAPAEPVKVLAEEYVEVEYRAYSHDGELHTPYTRFALVLPEGSLPRVRRDMFMKPKATGKLGPTTRAEVEAIGFGKVRLLGRGKAPSVEVWAIGWLDENEVTAALEKALPRLESLASRPWTG